MPQDVPPQRPPAQASRRGRGRPARINRDRILTVAAEIGVENLTMTAVAERLGTTHQALYTWVKDRDELVELVSDLFVQRLEPLVLPDGDWRQMLRGFAHTLRRVLADIPGFAAVGLGKFRTSGPFLTLNERVLHRLVDAGFDPPAAQRIYHTFGTAVLGWITREEAYAPLRHDPRPVAESLDATVRAAPGDLDLVAQVALPEFLAPADERFAFLVDTLIAGLPEPPTPRDDDSTSRTPPRSAQDARRRSP